MRSHIMRTCVNVHIVPTCARLSSTVCWNKNAAAQTARASQQSLHVFLLKWSGSLSHMKMGEMVQLASVDTGQLVFVGLTPTKSFQKLKFGFSAIFFGTYSRIRLTKWTIPSPREVLTWLPLDGCWQRGLMVSSNRASFSFLPVLSACLGVAKQLSS